MGNENSAVSHFRTQVPIKGMLYRVFSDLEIPGACHVGRLLVFGP